MTITPEQAIRMTEDEKTTMGQLEREIDKTLRKDFQRGNSLNCTIPSSTPIRVREEITRRYEEAGWNVQYHSHQLDGDYIEFSQRKGYEKDFQRYQSNGLNWNQMFDDLSPKARKAWARYNTRQRQRSQFE